MPESTHVSSLQKRPVKLDKANNISSSSIWKKLKHEKSSKWAIWVVSIMFFIAVFTKFIANDRPIYCKYNGQNYFPVFNQISTDLGFTNIKILKPGADWYELQYETSLWPIIPFASNTLDLQNAYRPPFSGAQKNNRFRHHLGTGLLGKDIAAGLVYGTRLAMIIGLISILIATLIGLFVGGIAGCFGDYYFKLTWLSILGLCLGLLAFSYYAKILFEIWSIDEASIFSCLLYTSPSPRDRTRSRMPSSA